MKKFIYLILFSFAIAFAETKTTTCKIDADGKEECIQSTCDAKDKCKDTLFNKQTSKTSPIAISPEAIQMSLLTILKINKSDATLTLNNGSVWNISAQNLVNAQKWMTGDTQVSVYIAHPVTYGESRYHLVNVNTEETVAVVYDPRLYTVDFSELSLKIASLDEKNSQVCLSDGTCWQYDPHFTPQPFAEIFASERAAIVGVNATFFNDAFPNILIIMQAGLPPKIIMVKQVLSSLG